MKAALVLLAVLACAAVASADVAYVTIEFDNRGSKVMSKDTSAKIMKALAEHAFLVPTGSVYQVGGMGQSNIVNHKSTVIYAAKGPASNGKSVLANCQAAAKSGWVSSSPLSKALKKATDTWAIGDSVKVKTAICSVPKAVPAKTGRKLML